MPVLYCDLEACEHTKSQDNITRFCIELLLLMKLFKTVNFTVVAECEMYFSFKLHSTLLTERVKKLESDYDKLDHCGSYKAEIHGTGSRSLHV